MSHEVNLGGTPSVDARRDAVHVPVVPMIAGCDLCAGERVAVDPANPARVIRTAFGDVFGIVDPFLKSTIIAGTRCWVLLAPGSITSLRHDWDHPALVSPPVEPEDGDDDYDYDGCSGCY